MFICVVSLLVYQSLIFGILKMPIKTLNYMFIICLSCWHTFYFQWQLLISYYDKFGASPNSTFLQLKPQVSTVMLVVKQIYAPKHLDLLSFNAFLVTTWQMPVMPFAAFERSWNCNPNLVALHLTPSGRLRNPRQTSKDSVAVGFWRFFCCISP